MIWAVLGIIVAVAAVIGGTYFLGRSHGSNSAELSHTERRIDALEAAKEAERAGARGAAVLRDRWRERLRQ